VRHSCAQLTQRCFEGGKAVEKRHDQRDSMRREIEIVAKAACSTNRNQAFPGEGLLCRVRFRRYNGAVFDEFAKFRGPGLFILNLLSS
jgi:hypothetical protein